MDEVLSNGSAINDKVSCNELQGLLAVFTERLQKLQRSFKNYFPEQMQSCMGTSAIFLLYYNRDINSPYTDHIIELQETEVKKRDFNTTNLQRFWCQQIKNYPLNAKVALEVLIPFVTTYLREHAFSILINFKAKK